MAPKSSVDVTVEGRALTLSNIEKVLYPATGFTKGQVIDYYTRIAPVLLPHLRRRALTLKRYPNGVDAHFFYEKNCPSHRPEWVETVAVWSTGNQADVNYCLANDLPTLVWVANLASLELHTSLARLLESRHPESVVSLMKKELRTGKVFIDWSQNDSAKTTVGVYSLRARPRPTVSTPVHWEEVERVAESGDASTLVFEAGAVLERLAADGDLFAPVLELQQGVPRPPSA